MTMKAVPYVLAGCVGALVGSAEAQSLMINASAVGQLDHRFAPGLVSYETQTFAAPTPAVTLRDYNAMTMTFSAPAGYAWQTDNDYWNNGNSLRCKFSYGTMPAGEPTRRADYSFDFVPGMANTVGLGVVSAWVTDTGFGFEGVFSFGDSAGGGHSGNVAFDALSVTLHAAPGVDPFPLDAFSQGSLSFEMTGIGVPLTDPGPHVSLVSVPEPGAGALMGLAGVVWISRRSLV